MHNNMDAIEMVMAIGRTLSLSPFAGKLSKRWMRTFATGPMALIMAAGAIGLTSLHAETARASLNPTAGDGRASVRAGALRDRRSIVSGDACWDAKRNHPRHRTPPDLVDKGGVATLLENRPEYILHKLALNSLGACCVPISPDYRAAETAYLIEHSEPDLVVTLGAREGQAREDTVESVPERRT